MSALCQKRKSPLFNDFVRVSCGTSRIGSREASYSGARRSSFLRIPVQHIASTVRTKAS
jgi:hypothetical protein